MEQYRFSPVVTIAVPLVLFLVQVYAPRVFPRLMIVDLPLLAVIFFSVARRNPIYGALTGAVIGLIQDAFTGQPIGINGMAKAVIGYVASSIGVQVDVENLLTRTLMVLLFSFAQSGMLYLVRRLLLGQTDIHVLWITELVRALVNTAIAVPLFLFLDRFKQRD